MSDTEQKGPNALQQLLDAGIDDNLDSPPTGRLSIDLGKSLSKVSDIRLVADYSDEGVTLENAAWVLEQSDIFVTAIDKFIKDIDTDTPASE